MVEYLQKPVFLSTLICIFLFYSGILTPYNKPVSTILKQNQIEEISGMIMNSPVKSSTGKTYSCTFNLQNVKSKNDVYSSAYGSITVFIKSEMIEAFFPGKIYSSAKQKGAFFYEAGAVYTFKGKFNQNGFMAESCSECLWPVNKYGKIDKFRALCRLEFKRLMYSWGKAGGLLLALLSGAREYTEPVTSSAFKEAGLSHILALSGMHLSMFSSIAVFIGNKVGRKKITFLIRVIALFIFVWFAGFSPSLLRAFICAMLLLIASMASVDQPDMIMILCFSFLLQVVISPKDIMNAGFLLSYGALAGILFTNKMFFRLYDKVFPGYIAASLSSSTGANLFTAPISLKIFGSFSPIGIIATTFVSPLVTIFIYSGLGLIILCLLCPPLVNASGIFMNLQYNIIKFLVQIFSKVPSVHI